MKARIIARSLATIFAIAIIGIIAVGAIAAGMVTGSALGAIFK